MDSLWVGYSPQTWQLFFLSLRGFWWLSFLFSE
jgi:hypothetical protein